MPTNRIAARTADTASAPHVTRNPTLVEPFLHDAAHVPGGYASGVCTPASEAEVAALLRSGATVLPVGAQSSLTGGATPRGEVVLSTRRLATIELVDGGYVRAGAGVPLAVLQARLAEAGLYYPPVPTYDGAFVGGTVATNAAGAATFKYGSTRQWVDALTVVLPDGDVLDLGRGEVVASQDGVFEIVGTSGAVARVPVPTYTMPSVAKLSAGYFAKPGMDLVDLFIGSEGTLGIVTSATLRVVPLPRRAVAFVTCRDDRQAVALTGALRREALLTWSGKGPLDVASVEYIGPEALALLDDAAFARSGIARPATGAAVLLAQVEVADRGDEALSRLQEVLESNGVAADPVVAAPGDYRGAERLFALREEAPATVNALIGAASARDPLVQKTAGDMVVPVERLDESIDLYRQAFETRGLAHATWGHASDGNLHPNVIPRTADDARLGREALLEIARQVIAMGGAPLAEHGVGRSPMKQEMLRLLYGDTGIDQMRAVKRAVDPRWTLAPGVLFPAGR